MISRYSANTIDSRLSMCKLLHWPKPYLSQERISSLSILNCHLICKRDHMKINAAIKKSLGPLWVICRCGSRHVGGIVCILHKSFYFVSFPGESGKSTLFKQMITIYGDGFTEAERKAYESIIYSNIIASMQTLIAAAPDFTKDCEVKATEAFEVTHTKAEHVCNNTHQSSTEHTSSLCIFL